MDSGLTHLSDITVAMSEKLTVIKLSRSIDQLRTLHHQQLQSNYFFIPFPISGNEQKYFSIDPATGKLFAIKEINRENLDSDEFLLELEATQRDNPLKSATTRVKIQIQDVNDNRPLFKTGHFEKSILENVPNGADIVKFTAIDKDSVRRPFLLYHT